MMKTKVTLSGSSVWTKRKRSFRFPAFLLLLTACLFSWPINLTAQTIKYTETMDAGTGATNGESINLHESNGRFDEAGLTYTGTSDMRNTLPSSGYASASGNFNVMFNSTGETFVMDGLNFSSCLSDIKLSFGLRKGTLTSDGTSLLIQYNTNEEPTIFNTITFPALPTGTGTATWYYVTTNSLIPSDVKSIRFSSNSAVELRLDDIEIQCNEVVCPNPTILTNPISVTSCQAQPVSFSSLAVSTTPLTYQWQVNSGSGFVDVTDGALYSGATEEKLVMANVTGSNSGWQFRCVITNSCGQSITTNVTLTVDAVTPPTITSSITPPTLCLGQSVVLTSSSATNNTWSTGETTQSITVSGDGKYSVKVTNNLCSETSPDFTVTVKDPSFAFEDIKNPTTCISPDGSMQMSGSGAGTVSYVGPVSSSMPATLPFTLSGLVRGTYDITFTAMPGCSSTQTITLIGDIPVPTITASGPLTFCDGDSVVLTSSALIGNTWSSGETTRAITVTASGTYNVTVTSGTCIKTSTDTIVTVNPKTVLTITTANDPSSCGNTDGSIDISGIGTGRLIWAGPVTDTLLGVTLPTTITGVSAGSYTIFFYNGFCQSDSIVQVLNDPGAPPVPTISAGGPTDFCDGGSVVLTSSSASNNVWSTGETTQSITVSTTGAYTVSNTLAGCTSTSTATVVNSFAFPPTPIITVMDTVDFCIGDSVILTSSALSNNLWSTGETSQSIVVNASGTFNVTVDNNGCTTSSSDTTVTVFNNTSLLVGSTLDPSTCGSQNGYIQIASINGPIQGGTLSWTGPTPNAGTTVTLPYLASALASGTYDFTLTTASGCTGTVSATITGASVLPTIAASGPLTFCEGGSVVLGSSSAVGNLWSTGETSTNITVDTTGTYTVTVTDGGCSLTSAPIVVTVNPRPIVSATSILAPSVCGDNDASITVSSTGTGDLNWVGVTNGSANGITTPFTVSNLTAGSYTFRFNNGCISDLYTFDILETIIPSTPVITASGSTALCTGQSVVLTSTSAPNYGWNNGATTQSITATASGNYTVTVTEGFCTETSDPLTVTVSTAPQTPTISSSDLDNTVCDGQTITLVSSAGGASEWSDGSTGASIVVSTSGVYNVSFTQNGCTVSSADISITVNPVPATPVISSSGATTFCDGENVTLSSSSASGNFWSTGATSQSITVNSAGSFTVTVILNGCSSSTSNAVSTTVNPIPSPILGAYTPICDTMPAFTLNQGLPAGGTYTVNGVAATTFDPGTANLGSNTIVYTVVENGCTGSATSSITVNHCTLGIDENNQQVFVVYPNPSTGLIHLQGEQIDQIQRVDVLDALGRVALSFTNNQVQNMNLSQLNSGLYTLIISGQDFESAVKVQILK